jgi:drug/metabolite transporter (DMT)-like permease
MWLANIGLLITAFAWGSQIPVLNALLATWDPYFLAAIRYVLAVPFLLLLLAALESGRGMLRALANRHLWILGGVLGVFVPMYTLGLKHADPNTAAILGSTGPVVGALVARFGFAMPLDRAMIPAMVLAMIGGTLATLDPAGGGLAFDVRGGEFLILIASACWAWYSLAAQRWLAGWSQLRISGLTMVTGAVASTAIYVVIAALGGAPFPPLVPTEAVDLGLFAWMTLIAVVAGILGWNHGVRRLGIVVASLFLNFVPVFAIIITSVMGTPPTAMQLVGGALVLIGVTQSQLRHLPWRRRAALRSSTTPNS